MPSVYNIQLRERKAKTIVAVLQDYFGERLHTLSILDLGCSSGIIADVLARHCSYVRGIDIDESAVKFAIDNFSRINLEFATGDAMQTVYDNNTFDVVICSHIYEHVPSPERMFEEILRILKSGGVCYFAGNNRLMYREPHYKLPLLSVLPRSLAHWYMKISGKGDRYHEKHLSYWGLKYLVRQFKVVDYTRKLIEQPSTFGVEYMLVPGSYKWRIAMWVVKNVYWVTPYIWLLEKPAD